MSSQHSTDVSFSLTCNSTGSEVSGIIWTRDGFLLSSTGPLVLTNSSAYSYTTVLEVNGRNTGMYTCQVRGINDQVLDSASVNIQGMLISQHHDNPILKITWRQSVIHCCYSISASPPPLNVVASQTSPSDPVEVSWSPLSGGATTITGYTIFYGNGANVSVPFYVTRIFVELVNEESVSIRSESTQLPSETIQIAIECGLRYVAKSTHCTILFLNHHGKFILLKFSSRACSCQTVPI